jgi:hypothetical protein
MGNRIASSTVQLTVTQDGLTISEVNSQSSTTLPGDNVPLFTVFNLVGPGNNTIPVPAKAAGVDIVMPVGSINPKLLKGVNGDTGVVFGPEKTLSWRFNQTSMANFVINSQVNETITLIWQ